MNIKNILFIITLFLIWIAGYYLYSPRHSENIKSLIESHDNQQYKHASIEDEQIVPIEEKIDTIQTSTLEEKTAIPSEVNEVIMEQKPQTSPAPQVKKRQKAKKKEKIRKEKANNIAIIQPSEPIIQQITSQHDINNNTKQETVSITSSLVKKDIGYYKMLSWHYPYLFNLTVNDQPLFTKKDKKIISAEPVKIPADKPFVIRYSYEWHTPWGKRIGAKNVIFKPNENVSHITVTFKSNWKDEQRIVVNGATKISDELLEEEKAP